VAEIELKLAADPDHLPALKQALEAMGATSAAAPSILNSTYYDSSDLKLWQNHLTLRVREQDGRHIQTLKSDGAASADALSRDEWEDVIEGDQPNAAAPATGPRLRDLVNGGDLHPLFRTTVHRTIIPIEPESSTRIEAAVDEGEIRGVKGDAGEPLSEIELELKSGEPAALYDVALRLLEVAPLRIETRSKAERGYRQVAADSRTTPAVRARPVALDGAMTVEAVLQSIGRGCLSHLLRNVPAAFASQAEAVHQIRVAARRLRSALSAAKFMLPPEQYHWALNELKWLAGSLGPVRNWDIFETSLLEPVERALPLETDLKRLAQAAERQRQIAYEGAKATIASQRYTATLLGLARWFETRGWRKQPASEQAALLFAPIGEVAPRFMERRWRQVRKRSKKFAELTPDERHRLRIALKKLRYTIEFLEDLFDDREVKVLEKRLRPLQDDLGRLNDVRTARELVSEVATHVNEGGIEISRAGGIVLGWHDRGLTDQEPKLRQHVRRLRRAKPFWPRPHPSAGASTEPAQASGQVVADH
jgi:triphosphatase